METIKEFFMNNFGFADLSSILTYLENFSKPRLPELILVGQGQAMNVLYLTALLSGFLGGWFVKMFWPHRPLAAGWLSMLIAYAIGHWAVPVFIMALGSSIYVPLFFAGSLFVGIVSFFFL